MNLNESSHISTHLTNDLTSKLLTATNQAPVIRVNSQWGVCVSLINSKWIGQIVYSILWDLRGYEGNQRKEWRGKFQEKPIHPNTRKSNDLWFSRLLATKCFLSHLLFHINCMKQINHQMKHPINQCSATGHLINMSVNSTILLLRSVASHVLDTQMKAQRG